MTGRRVPFVDLSAQNESVAPGLRDAVARVMKRGWFVLGPEVEAFEHEFAQTLGVAHAIGVASGTDALSLALWGLGVGAGDEVITTPMTAVFTALAITRVGARPIFADVEPDTLNLSVASVRKRIGAGTKAILPVHLYGNPSNLTALTALARERGVALIEDACQAHGATLDGKPVGGWSQAGCFSFYPTKNLGALGDGGMVVTNDPDLAERLRRLRNGGQSSRYVHEEIGFNSRLDELQAAILRVKLPSLQRWNDERRRLATLYRESLADAPLAWTDHGPGSSLHLQVARLPEREQLQEALGRAGVQTLVHYPVPVHLQPAYRGLGQREGTCPVAEEAAGEILSFPLYPELTEDSVEYVAQAVRAFYHR